MKKIYRLLYTIIGKWMPLSNSKFNVGQKKIRNYFAKHCVDSIGKNVNVRKSAFIQKYVIISEQKNTDSEGRFR